MDFLVKTLASELFYPLENGIIRLYTLLPRNGICFPLMSQKLTILVKVRREKLTPNGDRIQKTKIVHIRIT